MMGCKILLLSRYGRLGASSRMRFMQYLPYLYRAGAKVTVQPLLSDEMLGVRYQWGRYGYWPILRAYAHRLAVMLQSRHFHVVWIEKEALPWFPAALEQWLLRGTPYALDFDDAIFHNYDLHRSAWVRHFYGGRIDRLMAGAHLVVAGNRYLADRATAAGARVVEVIPTVVDLERYRPKHRYAKVTRPRIVWIGSPSTITYLRELAGVFCELAKQRSFTLRVVGGGVFCLPGVDVESLPWSEEREARLIEECDIGIMPLKDSPWERGKCAYKLIQYMACGLPTVASPVGANNDVVLEGRTGLFASDFREWLETLTTLLDDAELRQRLGRAGRARVEAEYCLQQMAPRLVRLLASARG